MVAMHNVTLFLVSICLFYCVYIQHATLVQQVNTETKGYMIEDWILSVNRTENHVFGLEKVCDTLLSPTVTRQKCSPFRTNSANIQVNTVNLFSSVMLILSGDVSMNPEPARLPPNH